MNTPRRLAVLALLCLPCTAVAEGPDPWDGPSFATGGPDLLRAAAAVPAKAGEPVVVLLEHSEYRYESDGRRTHSYRQVYRVDSDDARDGWADVSTTWAPWNQERPSLRARVVAPDGTQQDLDPATVAESGVGENGEALYSDRRRLQAPLPAFKVGSIVEYETVVRDTRPSFSAGTTGVYFFGASVPLHRSRLLVDTPSGMPVQWVARLLPGLQPRRDEADGRVRLTFERTDVAQLADLEEGLPPEVARWPHVAFSTARSWAEVASAYAALVEPQLAGAPVEPMARQVAAGLKDRRQIVERLLAELHRRVRYTGVEFGEASIVPRTPAEVLSRHYGDCKDKAALLVAMLRALGIPAQVALLSAGYGEDLDDQPPGLGWFDHAIVHVGGDPELWVDATVERAHGGELPLTDQGRLALVADPATTARRRLPETTAAENGSVETREFLLSEQGGAAVVETTEYAGAYDRYYRGQYADTDPESERKSLTEYVKKEYLAQDLRAFSHADARNLAEPFRLKVEAGKAGRGTTDEKEAVVAVFPSNLLLGLPDEVQGSGDDAGKDRPRTQPYQFATPHFAEYRYRIVPPPGFTLADTPADEEVALGPARLTMHWTSAADGVVTGRLRFESGPRRIEPGQFAAMRKAVLELAARPPALVRYYQRAERQLAEGRVAEALGGFRELVALHPREALHHTQVSLALLAGGLGEAARVEARQAVAVEPDSWLAQRRLGWVLQHDLIGRRFGKGFDLAGALAAHRRSVELAPQDVHTRLNLAFLLEHNAQGERWGLGAPLSEAADEHWKLSREHGEHSANLPHVLLRAGRIDELAEAAKGFTDSAVRASWEVTAAALTSRPAAAISRAAQISSGDARRAALIDAGERLVLLRRYAEGAALLGEAAAGASNAAALRARAEMLSKVKRSDEMPDVPPGPGGVVRGMMRGVWTGWPSERVLELFVTSEREVLASRHPFGSGRRLFENERRRGGLPADTFADLLLSGLEIGAEGDDAGGWRVRAQGAWPGARPEVAWVVREAGAYRILCSAENPWALASEALRRVDEGDLAGARRLLDWAREGAAPGAADPLGGDPLARFWTAGDQGDAAAVRLAAASELVGYRPTAARGLAVLEAAREPITDDDRGEAIDLALQQGYSLLGRNEEALAVAGRLTARHPSSPVAFSMRVGSLVGLKRWTDLRALAQERLRAIPGDPAASRALREAFSGLGDLAAIEPLCQPLLESGRAEAGDFNECAWNGLLVPSARGSALARARRAVELSNRKRWGYLHTLAAVYAESDQPGEARDVILEGLSAGGQDEPSPSDWYVFGRIAEAYGARDAARSAYARVEKDEEFASSTWHVAQLRVAAMDKLDRQKTARKTH